MKVKPFHRLKSTRKFVQRSEARIHRLAAACSLGIQDLNEERIHDVEQKMIREDLKAAEDRLWSVLSIVEMVEQRTRAKLARPERSGILGPGNSRTPDLA